MISSIKGFESNVSYYNINTTTNLKENSNIEEQITQNQTNEKKLEENTKDIITKIKEKQKTQSKKRWLNKRLDLQNIFINLPLKQFKNL